MLFGELERDINCSPKAGIIFTLIHPNSLLFSFFLSLIYILASQQVKMIFPSIIALNFIKAMSKHENILAKKESFFSNQKMEEISKNK